MHNNGATPLMTATARGTADLALTIIIPVRCAAERIDAIERLSFITHDTTRPDCTEVLVVDDGSPCSMARQLRQTCAELGLRYLRIDSEAEPFSIGRARNAGVQAAHGRHVMFQDIDLMPVPDFYRNVLLEIEVQRLDQFAERFLMFGVIYLTPEATREYLGTRVELRRSRFIQHLMEADTTRIEKFSTGTSVTVWNRHYFLATGGNDPDFAGWGYEDIEYMCRAIRRANRFPLPEEFPLDYRNFQTIGEYRGWKSVYRLFGDMTFQKGMVMFHAWHPVEQTSTYARAKDRNRRLFEAKLAAFKATGEEPAPLPMPERGRSIIFRTNPWVYNRWIAPLLGEITLVDEEMFTPESFLEHVRDLGIDRVVFHNPYANPTMEGLYGAVRQAGIPFLICERGALPDSVFFDDQGFNGESGSYAPARWRRPLDMDQEEAICQYIRDHKAQGVSLEDQPERIGAAALRRKMKIFPGSKILFVPLQRPSDTVITHLAGPIGSYDNFLALVKRLTHTLPAHWTIVVKRHPLEVESPDLPGVIFADEAHVDDLIEACDALLLINSGVGLLGLLHQKLVLHAGQAFYGHPGLAHQVTTHEDVLHALRHVRPDREAMLQFLHYLVFEFYSFARFKTRRVAWKDGALMTATTAIDYRVVRVPACPPLHIEQRQQVEIADKSILFDRYRGLDGNLRRHPQAAAAKPAAPKPAASKPAPPKPATPSGAKPPSPAAPTTSQPALQLVRTEPAPDIPPLVRKFRKLRSDPVMFMRDSRHPMLRAIGWSIRHD